MGVGAIEHLTDEVFRKTLPRMCHSVAKEEGGKGGEGEGGRDGVKGGSRFFRFFLWVFSGENLGCFLGNFGVVR